MNALFFKNLWNAIIGLPPVDDLEMIWDKVKNDIIGNLKREFLYDQLEIWSDNTQFSESSNEFADYLMKHLISEDDAVRCLAHRLGEHDGIHIQKGVPAEKTGVMDINLPNSTHVWFSLSKLKVIATRLLLSGESIETITLEPNEWYTLGRDVKSGNTSKMITIEDDSNSVSGKQAVLFFRDGRWRCHHISANCMTYIQHFGENRVANVQPVALTDNRPYENKIEFYNPKTKKTIVLHYDFINEV